MCFAYTPGNAEAAAKVYTRILAGDNKDWGVLVDYLRDRLYEICVMLQIVVVKHSGGWAGGRSDHTTIRPTNIIPVALKHPHTRFDLYHAGTPLPMDAGMIARAFSNVWLNLCWSHHSAGARDCCAGPGAAHHIRSLQRSLCTPDC